MAGFGDINEFEKQMAASGKSLDQIAKAEAGMCNSNAVGQDMNRDAGATALSNAELMQQVLALKHENEELRARVTALENRDLGQ